MRKTITLKLTATLLLLLVSSFCFAQNHVKVYGNVGVGNVNISVLNTDYGTSSDKNGDYSLSIYKSENHVALQFSCIGYCDTLITLRPKHIKSDSINISFKMSEETEILDQVTVFAERTTRYQEQKYVILDFDIYDDMFLILQNSKENLNGDFRVLVTDLAFNAVDTIDLPQQITPLALYHDCAEQCQIITQDSVYQIVRNRNQYSIGFAVEFAYFIGVLYDCIFLSDDWIYIKKAAQDSYNDMFYRVNINDKHNELLFRNFDEKSAKEYAEEMKFYMSHYSKFAGPNPEEYSVFLKKAWIHPKSSHLYIANDTLYYFNHVKSVIESYNENMELLHSCKITYPETENFWRFKIYQDKAFGRFYTIFGDKLNEINVKTGKTYPKATVNQYLNRKFIIYKGAVYILKRMVDSSNSWVSYIDRIELD